MCRDDSTDPGFDVSFSSTVNVSGGGTALATAVTAAGPGTRLLIQDSLEYSEFVILDKTDLVIEGADGQLPTISRAAPGAFPRAGVGWEVSIQGVCDGLKFKNLRFLDRGNRDSLSFANNGCIDARDILCLGLTRLIIEDCAFEEGTESPLNGKNGIFLGCGGTGDATFDQVVVSRCTFDTMSAGANTTADSVGVISIFGFNRVWIQNSWIFRDDALVARSSSHARGVVLRNADTIVENVLSDDIGTAGSNESFKTNSTSGAQFGSAVGPTEIRNCVAYESKRGFRAEQPSASTMTVTSSVYYTPTAGITDRAFRLTAGSALVVQDTVAVGAGTGTAFESASIVEDHNDIFNFSATGKVLDPTDLTIDPLFLDSSVNQWVAEAPELQTTASDGGAMGLRYPGGEEIIWCGQ